MSHTSDQSQSLQTFEERVDGLIQAYLHYEKRMPTYEELLKETQLPLDSGSTQNWEYHYSIFSKLENI